MRQNDGGLASVLMVVWGRLVAAALAKVGRCSSGTVTSPRRLSSSLEMDEQRDEARDSLDRLMDI